MKLYKSNLLNVNHCFTTRNGGCSKEPYASLNVAYHVGDRRDDVVQNHKLLAHEAGYDFKKLVFMNQIHSNKVELIGDESFSIPSCDALVTNVPGIPLMVMSADCAPLLFHDEANEVVAAAHVGRAGAFGDIISNVLQTMQLHFASNAADIKVVVGPRICKACYEVGQKEIDEAKELGYGFACEGSHLNIDAIIAHQLASNGIAKQQTEFLPHCTRCEHEEFFSYRHERTTGRNAAVIVL